MNELDTKRKELDNQLKKLDKEDSNFISGILQYLGYYDFSKIDVLSIKEELINTAQTSRANRSKISTKITNQKEYCDRLIKKHKRKELNYVHFLNSLPYDLLITFALILLLLDGSRNPITNTYSLSEILVVRLSYIFTILTASIIGIMMRNLSRKLVFRQKIYYRYLFLVGFSGPFLLGIINNTPELNTELFRISTLNVFMVTIALGIFAIYRRVKENYM